MDGRKSNKYRTGMLVIVTLLMFTLSGTAQAADDQSGRDPPGFLGPDAQAEADGDGDPKPPRWPYCDGINPWELPPEIRWECYFP